MFWYYVLMFEDEAKTTECDKTHTSVFGNDITAINNDNAIEILNNHD